MKKSLVVFDFDDTLIPSTKIYALSLQDVGIDPNGKDFLQAREAVKSRLPKLHTSARNRVLYFKALLEFKGNYSASTHLNLCERYESRLRHHVSEYWRQSQRAQLLEEFSSRATLAIATNENLRTQTLKLAEVDPDGRFFDAMVCSDEVGFEKPHGAILDQVLNSLAQDFQKITMIGDSIEHDLLPARVRGWQAILTTEFIERDTNNHGFAEVSQLEAALDHI